MINRIDDSIPDHLPHPSRRTRNFLRHQFYDQANQVVALLQDSTSDPKDIIRGCQDTLHTLKKLNLGTRFDLDKSTESR